jgi:hypothetical protein
MAQGMIPLDADQLDAYLSGRMNKLILSIYKRMNIFIRMNSVIIEDVYNRVKMMRKMEYGKITREFMAASLRDDQVEVDKSKKLYARIIQSIEFSMVNLNSSYNLGQFLRDNGVPPGQVRIEAQMLRDLWQKCYGTHLARIEKMKTLLAEMKGELENQENKLVVVGKTSFLEGIYEHQQINDSFERERAMFWEFVKISRVTRAEQKQMENLLGAQIIKVQAHFKAVRGIMDRDLQVDLQERNLMERQVVRLTYTLGAVALLADVPDEMLKRGIGGPLDWLLGRKKKGLSESGTMLRNQLVKALKQLAPIPI